MPAGPAASPRAGRPSRGTRASLLAGGTAGVGVMAALDEIVFHQLLAWHHFYDRSTPEVALLSDGLLHATELLLLIAGVLVLVDLQRRGVVAWRHAAAGLVLGAGAFQLFDGLVNHKVLRLHQVRYGVDLAPYDVGWNLAGAVLLLVGAALALRAHRSEPPAGG